MTTLTVKLPEQLSERLTKLARRRGMTRSQLVRGALEHALTAVPEGEGASCLDLARDLVGKHGGPPTLSSDKRHMKGYGR